MRLFFIFILALSLNAQGLFRATASQSGGHNSYYVSTVGNDSNPGTIGSPFLTIAHAASIMLAGDTTYIRAGTYNESIVGGAYGQLGYPITYSAYPSETVVMDGSTTITGMALFSGSIYSVSYSPAATLNNPYVWQDDTTFLTKETSTGAMIAGSYYNDGAGTLYVWCTDSANPNTHTIRAGWLNTGFYSGTGGSNTVKSHIALRNLTLQGYGRAVDAEPTFTSVYWELDTLNVLLQPAEAIWIYGGGDYTSDWYIHGGRYWKNHGHGIQANGNRTRIIGVEADHNEWGGAYTNGGDGLIVSGASVAAVVESNTLHDNGTAFGSGMALETSGVIGTIVSGNNVYGNRNGCVGISAATSNLIAYNLCHDNWRGGSPSTSAAMQTGSASTSNLFYNNTLHNNYSGWYTDSGSGSGLTIENNINWQSQNALQMDLLGTASGPLNYNNYLADALGLAWNGSTYSTLATWQSASSQDANSLNTNPLFTSVVYGWDGFEDGALTCSGDGGWWQTGSCSTATLIGNIQSPVEAGIFSARVKWTGTSQSARAYHTVPVNNSCYIQFEMDVTAIAGGTAQLEGCEYTFNIRAAPIVVEKSASTYTMNLTLTTSSGTTTLTGATVLNFAAWHKIEFYYAANSATVGGGTLWIDGTQEVSNLTLNTTEANSQPTRAYVGLNNSTAGATSGTIYFDQYVYDTSPIGNRAWTDFTLQGGSPMIAAGVYIPGVSTANPPNIGAR